MPEVFTLRFGPFDALLGPRDIKEYGDVYAQSIHMLVKVVLCVLGGVVNAPHPIERHPVNFHLEGRCCHLGSDNAMEPIIFGHELWAHTGKRPMMGNGQVEVEWSKRVCLRP